MTVKNGMTGPVALELSLYQNPQTHPDKISHELDYPRML
jgi:hypothetical protein